MAVATSQRLIKPKKRHLINHFRFTVRLYLMSKGLTELY